MSRVSFSIIMYGVPSDLSLARTYVVVEWIGVGPGRDAMIHRKI